MPSQQRPNDLPRFNTRNVHDFGSRHVGPEQYSHWTETEAVRSQQLRPQRRPPPGGPVLN